MKRVLSLFMALVIMMTSNSVVEAASGNDSWFAEEIEKADDVWKIVPKSFENKDLSKDMSRAEFSEVLIRGYLMLFENLPQGLSENPFSDTNDFYVNAAYQLGLVGGYPDGTFRPDNTVTRQEILKMICSLLEMYKGDYDIDNEQMSKLIGGFHDHGTIKDWAKKPIAVARYEGIVKGDQANRINPLKETTRAEGIIMVSRMLDSTVDVVKVVFDEDDKDKVADVEEVPQKEAPSEETPSEDKPKNQFPELEPDAVAADTKVRNSSTIVEEVAVDPTYNPNDPLNQLGSNQAKQEYVYGDGDRYTSDSEARQHLVNVTIDVWSINSSGVKYATTKTLSVNEALADRVKLIFDEIFAGDEKFPIKSIHAYAWRSSSTSEHNQGMAIDINPNENYMIRNGGIVAGTHWKPGEDVYSILPDGDVVNAFNKYGFAWGGNYWRSANDYMHFSYFGR